MSLSRLYSSKVGCFQLIQLETLKVRAITEDENKIGLRDANSSRERPKLDGFDIDEDDMKYIEVRING